MATTLKAAVDDYLRAKSLARGTRNEYFSTLRKWEQWGGGVPIEKLRRKDVRAFLDWVYERAVAEEGKNPGRTTNKAREHLRAALSWSWEQELIDAPPRFPKPREQRDVAGRHYLTKAEINALYFATHSMPRPRGWDSSIPVGRYWRAALVVFYNYGVDTGTVCKSAVPRADSLAARFVGPPLPGSGGQRAVPLGLAVLPEGEDGQGVLPADEPRRPRPPQEHPAGKPAPRRLRFPWRRSTPECAFSRTLRPRRHPSQDERRDWR